MSTELLRQASGKRLLMTALLGWQVFVAEMEADVPTCINRNIHKWTEYDIEKVG